MTSYLNVEKSEANFSSFLRKAEEQLYSCDTHKRKWEVELQRWRISHPHKGEKDKYRATAEQVIKDLETWKTNSIEKHEELKKLIHIKPKDTQLSKSWESLSKLEPQFATLCNQINDRLPRARTACQSLYDADKNVFIGAFNYLLGRTPDISSETEDPKESEPTDNLSAKGNNPDRPDETESKSNSNKTEDPKESEPNRAKKKK